MVNKHSKLHMLVYSCTVYQCFLDHDNIYSANAMLWTDVGGPMDIDGVRTLLVFLLHVSNENGTIKIKR